MSRDGEPARATTERLAALQRTDKHQLSAGDGAIWAPPHPVWLDRPGFWDEAHLFYHPVAPLYGIAIVGASGTELELKLERRTWQPNRLDAVYRCADAQLEEVRCVLPGGRFRSVCRLADGSSPLPDHAQLVAYTAQPEDCAREVRLAGQDGIEWRRDLQDRRGHTLSIQMTLCVDTARPTRMASRAEGVVSQPRWMLTPFAEWRHQSDAFRAAVEAGGVASDGLLWCAVASGVALSETRPIVVEMRVAPSQSIFHPLTFRCNATARSDDPQASVRSFFENAPHLRCDDPFIERYYDYRLNGLHLCHLSGGAGNVRHDAVAEGIGYFHVPISYSAQCHMYEMRWSQRSDAAWGSICNFLENQNSDGSFHGRIYTNHLEGTDFYHANWGDALLAVHAVQPDDERLRWCYDGLTRYAYWLVRSRDPESSGMLDVINHFETGQEYMSRYQVVNPSADTQGWSSGTRLKAVDVTVYARQLFDALARVGSHFGFSEEAANWQHLVERTNDALLDRMWDPVERFFSDVDPRSMRRTGVKAAVCFYPMLTSGCVSEAMLTSLLDHLEDPHEFGAAYPWPSSSLDDPLFSAEPTWNGRRHNCPWNGRVWPMTTSHIIEGLIRQWRRRDPGRGESDPRYRAGLVAARALTKFIRTMFHDGDLERPNCYEHYNPRTGAACTYRGIDDYQHSWVNDLIIRGVLGFDPGDPFESTAAVDPLPMDIGSASLDNLHWRGYPMSIQRRGGEVSVTTSDAVHDGCVGTPTTI